MASFAKVSIIGNLGADPETKYTPNGTMVVELRLAVNPRQRGGQGQQNEAPPTWYRISAWDRLADSLDKMSQQGYIAKGRPLYVEGRLEPREYTTQDGQNRVSFDVTMTDWQFVGSRQDGDQSANQDGGGQQGSNRGGGNSGTQNSGENSYGNGGGDRRQSFDDNPAVNDPDDVPF